MRHASAALRLTARPPASRTGGRCQCRPTPAVVSCALGFAGSSELSLDIYTRFVLALAAILVLLGLFAWLGRRFGLAGRPAAGGKRRLAIVEIAPIDSKRRLVLLRRGHTET